MIPVSFTQVGLGPVSSIQSSILQNGEEMDRFKCVFFIISYNNILSLVNIVRNLNYFRQTKINHFQPQYLSFVWI